MLLDGSETSLAVLDHYLSQVPRDRPEIVSLVAPAVAAYFGEVVRHRFGGEWVLGEDPASWQLVLPEGAVTFSPVGQVVAAIFQSEVDGYDTGFEIAAPLRKDIEAALGHAAPVTAEYYYSLTGRFETLHYLMDLVAGLKARAMEEQAKKQGATAESPETDGPKDADHEDKAEG